MEDTPKETAVQPILIIVLATAAGVPLGLWLRRNLSTLGYRNVDEVDLPAPRPRSWVVWASCFAIGGLAAAAGLSRNPLVYLPLLPLAVAGPWLAAVDFDVFRIPNRVLVPTAAATLLIVAGVAAETRDWRTLIVSVVTALPAGAVFAAVHVVTKGGIGFGDVKLAVVVGFAVGPLGAGAAWLGILTGSVAALVWAKATHTVGPIPLGPWLLFGVWIAVLARTAVSG